MFSLLRLRLALWISPEFTEKVKQMDEYARALALNERAFNEKVNIRVADIITQMDPFEPLMRKYHGVFSEQYERVEDKLDDQSKLRLFMWAFGVEKDPSFKYLTDWIQNTQGNATLRKAKTDHEWFYGRVAIAMITLLTEEVSRLASHYKSILAKQKNQFDPHEISN